VSGGRALPPRASRGAGGMPTGRWEAVKYEAPAIVDRQAVEGLLNALVQGSDQIIEAD